MTRHEGCLEAQEIRNDERMERMVYVKIDEVRSRRQMKLDRLRRRQIHVVENEVQPMDLSLSMDFTLTQRVVPVPMVHSHMRVWAWSEVFEQLRNDWGHPKSCVFHVIDAASVGERWIDMWVRTKPKRLVHERFVLVCKEDERDRLVEIVRGSTDFEKVCCVLCLTPATHDGRDRLRMTSVLDVRWSDVKKALPPKMRRDEDNIRHTKKGIDDSVITYFGQMTKCTLVEKKHFKSLLVKQRKKKQISHTVVTSDKLRDWQAVRVLVDGVLIRFDLYFRPYGKGCTFGHRFGYGMFD